MIINNDQIIYKMDQNNKAVAYVDSGSKLTFVTCDCFSNQINEANPSLNTLDWDAINPATGPVYINDAMPGDVLSIKINKIDINNKGVVATGKEMGVLGSYFEDNHVKIVEIKDNHALFNDFKIPLNKMIGVIGTAPCGEGSSCGTPGDHGGNMDSKVICEGATLYLSVNVPGALLALGDLHACMGDGEVGVSGLEVAGEVQLEVNLLKDSKLITPLVINEDKIITIASAIDIEEAIKKATYNMAILLQGYNGMTLADATMFLSLVGQLHISQVVDPLKTVRMEVAKQYFK